MESIVQALASGNDKFLLDLRDPDLCPVQTVSLLSQASFHQPLVCYLWWWHLWVGQCLVPQSHLSLCSPMNWSPPGCLRILQARIMEWVAMPFSRGYSPSRDGTQVSCIAGGFFTSWTTREAWWHRYCDAIFIQHVLEVVYQFLAPCNYHKALTHCNKCDFSRATTWPIQAMTVFRQRF